MQRRENSFYWEREGLFDDPPLYRFLRDMPYDRARSLDMLVPRDRIAGGAEDGLMRRLLREYTGDLARDTIFCFLRPDSKDRAANGLRAFCFLGSRDSGHRGREGAEKFVDNYRMEFANLHKRSRRSLQELALRRVSRDYELVEILGSRNDAPYRVEAMVAALLSTDSRISSSSRRLLWEFMWSNSVWEEVRANPKVGFRLLPLIERMGLVNYRYGAWRQVLEDWGRYGLRRVWAGKNIVSGASEGIGEGKFDSEYGMEILGMEHYMGGIKDQPDWLQFTLSQWAQLRVEVRGESDFWLQVRERESQMEEYTEIVISVKCVPLARGRGGDYELVVTPLLDEGECGLKCCFRMNGNGRLEGLEGNIQAVMKELQITYRLASLLARFRSERNYVASGVSSLNAQKFESTCQSLERLGRCLDALGI